MASETFSENGPETHCEENVLPVPSSASPPPPRPSHRIHPSCSSFGRSRTGPKAVLPPLGAWFPRPDIASRLAGSRLHRVSLIRRSGATDTAHEVQGRHNVA